MREIFWEVNVNQLFLTFMAFTPRRRFSLGGPEEAAAAAKIGTARTPSPMLMMGLGSNPSPTFEEPIPSSRSEPTLSKKTKGEMDDIDYSDDEYVESSSTPVKPSGSKPLPSPASSPTPSPSHSPSHSPPPLPPKSISTSGLSSALKDYLNSVDRECGSGSGSGSRGLPLPTSPDLLHKCYRKTAAAFKQLMKEFQRHAALFKDKPPPFISSSTRALMERTSKVVMRFVGLLAAEYVKVSIGPYRVT